MAPPHPRGEHPSQFIRSSYKDWRHQNMKKILDGHLMDKQNILAAGEANSFIILGKDKSMSWTTVYIAGKTDFREDVKKKLAHSDQRYMPGFIEKGTLEVTHDLYWIDERTSLRSFKETIGGKLVWKHRLHFFETLEAFIASQEGKKENPFSEREREMIAEMQ